MIDIVPTEKITELEDGLSAVCYEGDYSFDEFLSSEGASIDEEVFRFLTENLLGNLDLGFYRILRPLTRTQRSRTLRQQRQSLPG